MEHNMYTLHNRLSPTKSTIDPMCEKNLKACSKNSYHKDTMRWIQLPYRKRVNNAGINLLYHIR